MNAGFTAWQRKFPAREDPAARRCRRAAMDRPFFRVRSTFDALTTVVVTGAASVTAGFVLRLPVVMIRLPEGVEVDFAIRLPP